MEEARAGVRRIVADDPSLGGRVRLVAGDITRDDLGLSPSGASRDDFSEVYHLAAAYDLGVGRGLATPVNVRGRGTCWDSRGLARGWCGSIT